MRFDIFARMGKKRLHLRSTEKTVKLTLVCRESTVKRAKELARKRNTSISRMVDRLIDSLMAADYQGRTHPGLEGLTGTFKGRPPKDGIGT